MKKILENYMKTWKKLLLFYITENYMIISKKLLIFYITERKYGKTIVYDELEEISEIVSNWKKLLKIIW